MRGGDRNTEVDGCFTGKEPHTDGVRGGVGMGEGERVKMHVCQGECERDKERKLV